MSYRAREPGTLFDALQGMFLGRSRKDLRRLLHDQRVLVNGKPVTDTRGLVKEGDVIDCVRSGRPAAIHPKVRIIYEDDHLFVVEKSPGILTSDGVRGKAATVEDVLGDYLRRRGERRTVHACHRLDRDVSGLLLLAKERRLAKAVRADPRRHLAVRLYHAIVEGSPAKREDTIRSYLRDGADRVVREAAGPEEGKLSVTRYRVLEAGKRYAALEVRLETGRKNQIRVHMRQIGHPIAGDRKYGARTDPAGRICLHAAKLDVIHPVTGEKLRFESKVPASFARAR